MNRFIITTTEIEKKEYRIAALCDARQKLIEVTTESMTGTSVLGNIYIGRVENVVKNLNAAFVCIAPGQNCYLPLQELKNPVFTKKQSEKEALKTKDPSVSTNLTFTGKYVILTTGKRKIGASSKLPKEKREKLLKIVEDFLSGKEQIPYGVIIRTNAAQASKEELLLELAQLEAEVQKIISGAKYLIRYSLVHKEEQPWQKMLNGLYETELGEVVTDDREIFETICNMYGVGAKQLVTGGSVRSRVDEILTGHGLKIRYYEDEMVSLSALSGITSQLHDALRERVWLKSGAYLIIQPTEALTVIDVNTGKNIAKKEMQENFLKVNIEAAEEIARQLRRRNISGIVIVDFINLEAKSAESELLNVFGAALKKDPVPTQIVEMTKLGLVEVTRKKIKKSLRESLS